jgi:hypothetical protein
LPCGPEQFATFIDIVIIHELPMKTLRFDLSIHPLTNRTQTFAGQPTGQASVPCRNLLIVSADGGRAMAVVFSLGNWLMIRYCLRS